MELEYLKQVVDNATLVLSAEQVQSALDAMAQKMQAALYDQNPVLLCVMNGGLMTTAELAKRLNFPLQLGYVHASRYAGKTTGSREIQWLQAPSIPLNDRVVVLVDDILDGGLTLKALTEHCQGEGAAKIYSAVLLDKPTARLADGVKQADFTGAAIEDKYVFGFGLDYHNYLRNMPAIYAVAEAHQ